MVSLQDILPPVSGHIWDREQENNRRRQQKLSQSLVLTTSPSAPPYMHRKGWVPRSQEDYGDGGAFPECAVAQYPLGMGKGDGGKGGRSSNNALAIQLDSEGKVKYDMLARHGHAKDKIVYSKLTDMLPSAVKNEDDPEIQKPEQESIDEITEKTRAALEKLTQSKIAAAMPVRCADKLAPAQYVRFTPGQQGSAFNSGAQQRVIKMVEMQKDPMEPPKFNISKKVPRGPPSPPAPVMHSPTKKVTVKEQQDWRIPPSVSNWKNPKGFTLPLDKRLAADGRGLQSVHINEKFAKLADALHIADRKAREQVEKRSQLEKMAAQKEKVRKEESLKMLAKRAREEQAGLRPAASGGDGEEADRDRLRAERQRMRKREAAISNKSGVSRERDITEQIALGLPQKTSGGGEAMFDQRLFNQSRGMDSGFGDDEAYSVYDKPWRQAGAIGNALYRPSSSSQAETFESVDELMAEKRFVPNKGFSGADSSATRSGPVEFQEGYTEGGADKEEEDLFGVIGLLSEAKNASKRKQQEEDRGADKRRRRD